jgi:hypothetical protein
VVFAQIRAPSTLGTFLRAFTYGHVQQLNAVARQVLIRLAERAGLLGAGGEEDLVVFVDLDSTRRQVYGYAKQDAAVGRLKVRKTPHPLLVTACTRTTAPVVVAARLRKGRSADESYTAEVVSTAARYGATVSLTTGTNSSITAAITGIGEGGWTPIHYRNAFVDTETGQLVSDAEVAWTGYTAFTSRPKTEQWLQSVDPGPFQDLLPGHRLRRGVGAGAWPLPAQPGRHSAGWCPGGDPAAGTSVRLPGSRLWSAHLRRADPWADRPACPVQPAAAAGADRGRCGAGRTRGCPAGRGVGDAGRPGHPDRPAACGAHTAGRTGAGPRGG